MNTDDKKYLTLQEVADRLGYAYAYAQQIWPTWAEFNVTAHRMGRRLLFKTEEIDRMVEAHAIN